MSRVSYQFQVSGFEELNDVLSRQIYDQYQELLNT